MASVTSLVGVEFGQDECRFIVQVLHSPTISDQTQSDDLMCAKVDSREWFAHIFNYLKIERFLNNATKSLHVRIWKLATHYIL